MYVMDTSEREERTEKKQYLKRQWQKKPSKLKKNINSQVQNTQQTTSRINILKNH